MWTALPSATIPTVNGLVRLALRTVFFLSRQAAQSGGRRAERIANVGNDRRPSFVGDNAFEGQPLRPSAFATNQGIPSVATEKTADLWFYRIQPETVRASMARWENLSGPEVILALSVP